MDYLLLTGDYTCTEEYGKKVNEWLEKTFLEGYEAWEMAWGLE